MFRWGFPKSQYTGVMVSITELGVNNEINKYRYRKKTENGPYI